MGAITSKEGLLEYLKQAINVESAVLSQKNLIQEYDENSEERKPQLKLLDAPEMPQVTCELEYSEKETYNNFLGIGIFLCIVGGIMFISALYGASIGSDSTLAFFGVTAVIIGIAALLLLIAYRMRKNVKDNYDYVMDRYYSKIDATKEKNERIKSKYSKDMDIWENSNESAHAYFEKPLKETQAVLDKLYSVNVIYPKYRNLPALTCIYEYLVTGRCDELAGPHGAYNLYEDEVRQNMVISQLNAIMENLEQIKGNQYLLYEQLTKIRRENEEITHELRMIHGYAAALTEISLFNTYYAGISAANSAALAYYRTL